MTTKTRDYDVLWVCEDCYLTHHGMAEEQEDFRPDCEPLSLIDDAAEVAAGLVAEEHDDECPVWLGDPNRPDVPVAGEECDCERRSFSWSRCEGCGSSLGGVREALTVWFER